MLSQKSIRSNFLIKLSVALAVLLLFFSTILYSYINYRVDGELLASLKKHAKYILATYPDVKKGIEEHGEILKNTLHIEAKILYIPNANYQSSLTRKYQNKGEYFIEYLLPYDFRDQSYLCITSNVTQQKKVQNHVYKSIILISLLGMFIIMLYAYFLSGVLMHPLEILAQKLSKRNENMMEPLRLDELPKEFEPLAGSINALINRIRNFTKYKKELFIGAAHELKTPLAVMKSKNQVTLIKRNPTSESLVEAIRQNITSIDEMNKIVSSILEFGRAEGAQFEPPQTIDVMEFLRTKARDYQILAETSHQNFTFELSPQSYSIYMQPLLLTQILQNLVQNALRFTPKEKLVTLRSHLDDHENLVIEVIDEGSGIDESKDYFAPFIRSRESSGAGLGLFLVNSAADAMGAVVTLANREDGQGSIATVIVPKYPFCSL